MLPRGTLERRLYGEGSNQGVNPLSPYPRLLGGGTFLRISPLNYAFGSRSHPVPSCVPLLSGRYEVSSSVLPLGCSAPS